MGHKSCLTQCNQSAKIRKDTGKNSCEALRTSTEDAIVADIL